MLGRIAVGTLVWAVCSAALAQSYEARTVETVQEALVRLGYDPGPIDGQWGGKARAATNALREANGLPPTKELAGSSLELVHRLSPGETTLPHPGILITDPAERRLALPGLNGTDPAYYLCQPRVGDGERIEDVIAGGPIAEAKATVSGRGYITRNDDWFTPIAHAVTGAHNLCIAGNDNACTNITTLMADWAAADALKSGVKRSSVREFDDTSWAANTVLRSLIFAYADARRLTPLSPEGDATVLDWLKRRVDEFHHIEPSGNKAGSIYFAEASNHALANMMPAAAFGAMVGDRSMMEPALERYRLVLSELRPDGSMPTEAKRGARALHYTNFQIGQLLSTAALLQAQQIDPSGPEAADGKTIPRAVSFALDAYENFDLLKPYAKTNEGPGPSEDYTIPYVKPFHLGWVPAYVALFGEDENRQRMSTLAIDARICSDRAEEEEKLPNGVCGQLGPQPPLERVGALWGTADLVNMGYSAACLQGDGSWPVSK